MPYALRSLIGLCIGVVFSLFLSVFLAPHAHAQSLSPDQPVHDVARLGTAAEMQALLKRQPSLKDVRTDMGSTPLHLAAYADKSANATLLLQAGADVNAVTSNGRTVTSMGRKTMANEAVGIMSLWMLKGCKPGKAGC